MSSTRIVSILRSLTALEQDRESLAAGWVTARRLPSAPHEKPRRVQHHGDIGKRLGRSGGDWRKPSHGGQCDTDYVIAGGEPEVLLDGPERAAADPHRLGHRPPVVTHERDVRGLDGFTPLQD